MRQPRDRLPQITPLRRGLLRSALAALLAGGVCAGCRELPPSPVLLASAGIPRSSDPVDQDLAINSLGFSPVHAPLVSRSRKGGYVGVLAESWDAGLDARVWRFRMRPGLVWETGEPITAEQLVAAWRRSAAVLARRKSADPVFSRLEGLSTDGRTLTLRFAEPFPKLLEAVGLPLYRVVHPSCYDPSTGGWLCARRAVASGPYRVARWNGAVFQLALRAEFPAALRHPRAVEAYRFVPQLSRDLAEIAVGASLDAPPSDDMTYTGGMESTIAYLRCQSWSHPESPFFALSARRALRAAFYREFAALGGKARLSFVPPAAAGVREASAPSAADAAAPSAIAGKRLSFRPSWSFTAPYQSAVERAAAAAGLRFERKFIPVDAMLAELASGRPRYENDLVVAMTTMGSGDPVSAMRDMFLSKVGVRLPDPTGRAERLLGEPTVDLQAVNEVLWDDALAWPVQHFGMGLWLKPAFDGSRVDGNVSPPALEWVGRA